MAKKRKTPEPNKQQAVDLVMQLMPIPGGSGNEAHVVGFLRDRLLAAGLPSAAIQTDSAHRRTPIDGNTGNLIVRLPGSVKAPRRMLTAHLDTVPTCLDAQLARKGNVVRSARPDRGIGADNRAGVGVLLQTLIEILRNDLPHPPLTFCWFVQEEIGLHGSRCVTKSKLGSPKMAFNWDGGSPTKLTVGATGGYRLSITVHGVASHAGNAPECGVSAINIASLAIADLYRNGWLGNIRKGSRCGTSNVGIIQGGSATNVVTDHVLLKAEARSHDADFRAQIVDKIQTAFCKAAGEVRNVAGDTGKIEFDGRLDYESFRLKSNSPCVQAAETAIRAIDEQAELAIANGGLDANWLNRHGIPTVSLGCGQRNQHMVTESLVLSEYYSACRIALRLATEIGGSL